MGREVGRDVAEARIALRERDHYRPGRVGLGRRRLQGIGAGCTGHHLLVRPHAGSRSFEDHPPDSPMVSGTVPEFTKASTIAGTASSALTAIGAGGSARRKPMPY